MTLRTVQFLPSLLSALITAVPAGSYVIHRAKGINYDGAKDEETIIRMLGMWPATSTPVKKK